MKTLTVITTTYNRAYCLHQVYESLCKQTSKDFIWMIVDDGSTDETKSIVAQWIAEKKIIIEYYYKPNGGMHTARNYAYEMCKTLLNVVIDSDDWMTDNAVKLIIDCWNKHGTDKLYGLVAYNIDINGTIIGTKMPRDVETITTFDLFEKYKVRGDKKIILRSDLSKMYPYPEFQGEKFYPASYKFKHLDQDYKLYILHEAVCVVDYNQNSMTNHKFAQYKSCCRSFAHYRNEMVSLTESPTVIMRHVIHYIAESIFAGDKDFVRHSSKPVYTIVGLPFGVAYYFYLTHTSKEH